MTDRRRLPLSFLAAAIALALPSAAGAQDAAAGSGQRSAVADPEDWILTIGGSLVLGPSYDGARSIAPMFTPSIDLRRAGEPATWGAPDDSLGIGLFDLWGIRFGPLAGIREGRPDGVLPGLPGYSWALQGGAFAEFWPIEGALRTRIEVLRDITADGGMAANLSADLVQKSGPFTWSIGPRMSVGDTTLMQTQFGVPPLTAAANGRLVPYDVDAGIKSLGLNTSLTYDWSAEWATTLYGSYQRLTGAAAASPVVTSGGSPNQLTLGLGFEHAFTLGH